MDRTYKDIAGMTPEQLRKELLELRVERYLSDADMVREIVRESAAQYMPEDKLELIDELYNEGYWA